ncbi:hypothetical protein C2G38_2212996 [Gigaspora rosea]|uniref:Uncharacterized protein n=1 Tax=Gigaspora rosea TaxID=44941 RepID=A0A397UCP8_9GLOM|nr:hypothetical protein C2G38_2212996 [Gigaspora rosea]
MLSCGHVNFEELEIYWKSIANNISSGDREWTIEVDFSQWFHRFSYDMIVTLITGERSYSMASYYNSFSSNKVQLPNELIENSNKFINEIRNHALGVTIFMSISSFMRHYNPFIKKKATPLLKNRDNLFKRLDDIIRDGKNAHDI